MSYMNPIDLAVVEQVTDDLEDNNAHTLCALLWSFYGMPAGLPRGVFDDAYEAAQAVIADYRRKSTLKAVSA